MKKIFRIYIIVLVCTVCVFDKLTAQNQAYMEQHNRIYSSISVKQIGEYNLITGFGEEGFFIEDAEGIVHAAAYQFSQNGGTNDIHIEQVNNIAGANSIFLYQSAAENNRANFTQQNGTHTLLLKETSKSGYNEAFITQLNGAGFINLERSAFLNNTVPAAGNTQMINTVGYDGIYQEGNYNLIVGAEEYYEDNELKVRANELAPARQISFSGSNWLEIWQTGGGNLVALYQEAEGDNTALINQQNGGNSAIIYQKNPGGSNYLQIEQFGGASAIIYQSGISGSYNCAIVKQN